VRFAILFGIGLSIAAAVYLKLDADRERKAGDHFPGLHFGDDPRNHPQACEEQWKNLRPADFGLDVAEAATRLTSYGFNCSPVQRPDSESTGIGCRATERGTGRYFKRTWHVSFDDFKGKFRAITSCF
jgi:hypothetical protein